MNWTELLIAIVSHTSWPLTAIAVAWMFRDALRSAFGRIESANSKHLKVTLRSREPSENLSRAEGIADALKLPRALDRQLRPKNEFEERFKQITITAVEAIAFLLHEQKLAVVTFGGVQLTAAGLELAKSEREVYSD